MLTCRELTKQYSGCRAVDGINLELEEGKIYALLGPNGSGKSTLMKMIVGIIKPTSGTIELDGVGISTATKSMITYMPTENYFYPYMKIKDIEAFFKDFYSDFDENVFNKMIQTMELAGFQDKVKNMSTGMLAKLKVAVAMSRNSKYILLDEPLNGIDIIARDHVIHAITGYLNSGKSIIVSSHLVDELDQVVDAAVFMKNGRIVMAGDITDIRERNDNMTLTDLYKKIYGGGYDNA